MATEGGKANPALMHKLLQEGHRFSFFQAVQLLERYCTGANPVGHEGPAQGEAIRFRPVDALNFPSSDVVKVEEIDGEEGDSHRFRLTTTFLGLYGTVSPLPTFYTEDIIWSDQDDTCVPDFLDIFHHRLLSLFYRSWLKYRYHAQFEYDGRDAFSGRIFSLLGLGTPSLTQRAGVPAVRLLRYTGLFTQQPRSAVALKGILSDYFDLPCQIEQCSDRWVYIKDEQLNAMGKKNSGLGVDMYMGGRVLDKSSKYQIFMGPMGLTSLMRFLPDGEDFSAAYSIAKLYSTDRLEFGIEVGLYAQEIPQLRLGSESVKLGWTSWMVSEPTEDVSVVFQPAS